MSVFINIFIFGILIIILNLIIKKCLKTLSQKVFLGLFFGILFGLCLNIFYEVDNLSLKSSITWFDVIGIGYIKLLQMVIMPLIFISILSAVIKLHSSSSLGKISFLTIGILLLTTSISALVGIFSVYLFNLDISEFNLTQGEQELNRLNLIENNHLTKINNLTIPQILLSFIPKNIFVELTGTNSTSIISIVIFSSLLGVAAIKLINEKSEKNINNNYKENIILFIDILQSWIMQLVKLIIQLTPYGVFALTTKMIALSSLSIILKLGFFVVASYFAISLMFLIHGFLLFIFKINPFNFFKQVFSVLIFAFTSRSSAATIPLNIECQINNLKISESIANFSASFGATIGQNGCAGIYPTMLAVMIAPSVGIDPFNLSWILSLVLIVTLSSLGVAGVGGGATFAALIVLPALGLPITLVALLISIEPIIDMGRTALNVNGSMVAGSITNKILSKYN